MTGREGEPRARGPAVGSGPLILAVDGGASKTDAWVVTEDGSVVGAARGPGSNHQLSGLDGAIDALGSVIAAALGQIGPSPDQPPPVATAVYCLAGMDLPVDEERLGGAITDRGWSAGHHLYNDTVAVLRAGARSGWGVGLVCGSGINCVGLGPDGTVERFPSLAELSGDFAPGGSWLGVRALGLALRAGDGRGGPTALAELVPGHFDLPDAEAVLTAVYTGTLEYGRLFELARVCLDAAAGGDAEATAAVDFLADEVALMATAAIGRLGVEAGPVEVVLGGGVFDTTNHAFTGRVETAIRGDAPRAVFRRLDAPPVLGAALLGLDVVGAPAAAEERLRATAPRAADPVPGPGPQ